MKTRLINIHEYAYTGNALRILLYFTANTGDQSHIETHSTRIELLYYLCSERFQSVIFISVARFDLLKINVKWGCMSQSCTVASSDIKHLYNFPSRGVSGVLRFKLKKKIAFDFLLKFSVRVDCRRYLIL